jgi:hypothetical protein
MTKHESPGPGPKDFPARSELEEVFQEGSELESQGKLDDAAVERMEERLRAVSARMDKELAEQLEEIKAHRPEPFSKRLVEQFPLPKPLAWLLLATLICGFIGVILEVTIGDSFIFSHANGYREARPLMMFILIPVFALLWFPIMRTSQYAQQRYPTGVIRWGIMFPLMTVGLSAMVYAAPLGWFALCGWAVGEPSSISEARVLSIRTYSKGCKLKAKVEVHGNRADVCLGGRITGRMPVEGESITVTGKNSLLGVYIDEIRPN